MHNLQRCFGYMIQVTIHLPCQVLAILLVCRMFRSNSNKRDEVQVIIYPQKCSSPVFSFVVSLEFSKNYMAALAKVNAWESSRKADAPSLFIHHAIPQPLSLVLLQVSIFLRPAS